MLASLYTHVDGDVITINSVQFQYNNHILTYNGTPIASTIDNANGICNIIFLDIPELKRTIPIIDYHRLENVYKFPKQSVSSSGDLRKKPFYYDLNFDIYFSPHKYDDIIVAFDLLFKTYDIEKVQYSNGYYIVYKGERIGLNIFFADDETGYIIELDYTDRNYKIFREFEQLMKDSIPDLS
jgi:hypothetical protein